MARSFLDVKKGIYQSIEDKDLAVGMERALASFINSRASVELDDYVRSLVDQVKRIKRRSIKEVHGLVKEAMESLERNGVNAFLARDSRDALDYIGKVVGTGKLVVKSKSIVAEEIGLRQYLESLGNEVWETDLGELLLQLTGEPPSHFVAVAMHLSRERVEEVLRRRLGYEGGSDVRSMVDYVRRFLRRKMEEAHVGITGANAVASREGALVQVENESNVRLTSSLPPLYIAVTGVDKMVPTLVDAIKVALATAYMSGGAITTYINVVSGPSGTRDIEHTLVKPAQGAKEMHVVLVDNGRTRALGTFLEEALACVRCGACQVTCPVLTTVGPSWGNGVYMGGIGVLWTAITDSMEEAKNLSYFCLTCGVCEKYCPVDIRISDLIRELRTR